MSKDNDINYPLLYIESCFCSVCMALALGGIMAGTASGTSTTGAAALKSAGYAYNVQFSAEAAATGAATLGGALGCGVGMCLPCMDLEKNQAKYLSGRAKEVAEDHPVGGITTILAAQIIVNMTGYGILTSKAINVTTLSLTQAVLAPLTGIGIWVGAILAVVVVGGVGYSCFLTCDLLYEAHKEKKALQKTLAQVEGPSSDKEEEEMPVVNAQPKSIEKQNTAPLSSAEKEEEAPIVSTQPKITEEQNTAPLSSAEKEEEAPIVSTQPKSIEKQNTAPLSPADKEEEAPVVSTQPEITEEENNTEPQASNESKIEDTDELKERSQSYSVAVLMAKGPKKDETAPQDEFQSVA